MADVYVCFPQSKNEEAHTLVRLLERGGLSCWTTTRDLEPGSDYREAVVTAIRSARAFALYVGSETDLSDRILSEVNLAAHHKKPSVLICDVDPSRLPPSLYYYAASWRIVGSGEGVAIRDTLYQIVSIMRSVTAFVSYHRADSAPYAGRLFDHLVREFGENEVFFDVDTIAGGADFEREIQEKVQKSRFLLAVIGPRWGKLIRGSSLIGARNWVRTEIEAALRAGIPVLPLLIPGARMPRKSELPTTLRAICSLNAIDLRDGRDFRTDYQRISETIGAGRVG